MKYEMKTYIIDYVTESGRKDFQCVDAFTPADAVSVFRMAGKSWLGTNFGTVEIISVTER